MSIDKTETDYSSSRIIQNERHWRILMDNSNSDEALQQFEKAFLDRYKNQLEIITLVKKTIKFVLGVEYSHGNLSSKIYLNHPFRVATIIVKNIQIDTAEVLLVALLHNILEVSKVTATDILSFFGPKVTDAIVALRIDRNRKEREYLADYYTCIKSTSYECAIVKVADKLDNIYMICFNPSESIRSTYLNEIDQYVVPLAMEVAPCLGSYLKEISLEMRAVGFLNKNIELDIARKEFFL